MAGIVSDEDGSEAVAPGRGLIAAPATVPEPLEVLLPCSVGASGRARQALRTWMAALGLPDKLTEDGTLVVSETVTNAVVHACSAPHLLVSIVDGRVRLEVHDTSRVLPVLRAPHASAGGQGLR